VYDESCYYYNSNAESDTIRNNDEETAHWTQSDVSGDGELMAMDNGNQIDNAPYDSGKRNLFNGKLVAVVKSTNDAGSMTLNIEADGIKDQSITIETTPDPEKPDEQYVEGYTMPKNYYVKLGYQPELVSEVELLF